LYLPTSAEATTGGGNAGDQWTARIVAVALDGTANLHVFEADGTTIAKTGVSQGSQPGQFTVSAGL